MAGSSSSYLNVGFGEDVLTEILSRLPVKSLLRFRCVCKYWYALIKSAHFITKHLQHNLTTLKEGNAPLFGTGFEGGKPTTLLWLSSINNGATPLVDDQFPSLDPNSLPFLGRKIIGPVNGIYFAIGERYEREVGTMYLWNPALGEVKAIPKVPTHPLTTDGSLDRFGNRFGFGYDSKTNDYKVIITMTFVRWRDNNYCTNVFLYSLRSNSWREIECYRNFHLEGQEPDFISHGNGVAHWLDYTNIVSFDFEKEVFLRSDTPKDDLINNKPDVIREYDLGREYHITVLDDESILLFVGVNPWSQGYNIMKDTKGGSCWEGWVMKEYGVKESWTKVFSTDYIPHVVPSVVGYGENNGEVILVKSRFELVSYNPNSQQMKILLPIKCPHVCNYMESLVSIFNIT